MSPAIGIVLFLATISITVSGLEWYDTKVLYQIYPKSFADSNGDGVGDLNGITSRVSHFKDLGVGAVWLSPIFQSPMQDNGYDISDYTSINKMFGTLDDLKALIKAFHDIGVKVLLDLVPNHTSEQHQWFKDSIAKINNKTDYYVWVKPDHRDSEGKWIPPNNWRSVFGGSAWTYNEVREEFYLHQFGSYQPDLNFRNPQVIEEMKNIMKYWMDIGIDGFRVDAVPHLVEDASLAFEAQIPGCEDANSYDCYVHNMTKDLPETFQVVEQLGNVLNDTKYKNEPRKLFVEAYSSIENTMKYYSTFVDPFNFKLIALQRFSNASDFVNTINDWMKAVPKGKTSIWVIGNHDNSRVATRMGDDMTDAMNMLVFFAPGNTVTYYGEELGMSDMYLRKSEQKDNRDPQRTPMQWNSQTNAGFSNATTTWLPVNSNYWYLNKEQQNADKRSHLSIYKKLIKLQDEIVDKNNYTSYVLSPWLFALTRSNEILVINLDNRDQFVNLTGIEKLPATLAIKIAPMNCAYQEGDTVHSERIEMRPRSGLILSKTSISGATGLQISLFLIFSLLIFNFL